MGLQVDWEGGHGVLYRKPGWIHEVVGHQVKLFQSMYLHCLWHCLCLCLILRVGEGRLVTWHNRHWCHCQHQYQFEVVGSTFL